MHLEHALYFATGVLLWWPVIHSQLSSGAKAAYVFAAFALASPIGLVMALVTEPLYDFYVEGPGLWGLDPLADQQIAGVTMSLTETVVFFAVFAVYVARFFREQDAIMRTNVTSMDVIRRLRSLFRCSSSSANDPADRRASANRRAGEDRRERLGLPPVSEERRSGGERRSGRDRRDESKD